MPMVATKGCAVGLGGMGVILTGDPTVLVNGQPVATIGSIIAPHAPAPKDPSHTLAVITQGSPAVLVNGKPIAYEGALASCKHVVITGMAGITVLV